jgi:DNA-binding ferritin-like protein (Dps family)
MVYSQLKDFSNLLELLPLNICACVILLQTSNQSGHWTSIQRYNNNIYYMDSYGIRPDGEMKHINSNVKYELGENQKQLTKLLKTMPNNFTFQYNRIQFQQYSPNINTCGRYNVVWTNSCFNHLTLTEFQQQLKDLKDEYKLSYDELICYLWKEV